ncbi:MAG: putative oxidoreductase [Verrucomicrobiales bacterium]|jgi:putative oxidoreductase
MPEKFPLRRGLSIAGLIVLRIILGGYFILAALSKIKDPQTFALQIRDYQILGDPWPTVFAVGLPWLELFAGIGIVIHRLYAGSLTVITGLLVAFMIALASLVARNITIDCSCGVRESTPAEALLIDSGLLAIAIALAVIEFCATRRKPA